MSKRFTKYLILTNILLSLVYFFSSYIFWREMNNWYDWNMQSTWDLFYVYPHRIPGLPTVMMPVPPMLNLPFIMFCIILVTNCVMLITYFFVYPRLQRWASKDV